MWRQRAVENNTYVAFANRVPPVGLGASGIFGSEIGREEALVDGPEPGSAALDIDTGSLSDRVATAPVRARDLPHKRVPAMYAPIVTPLDAC